MTCSRFKDSCICALTLALFALPQVSGVSAQEEPEDPRNDLAPPIQVPNDLFERAFKGGGFSFGVGGASSVSVTKKFGVTTTKISRDGKNYTFIEDADGLAVEFVASYTKADAEKIKEEHPDLYMHLMAFPDDSEGNEVSLVINVKKRYEADSRDDLKSKHPELSEILEKSGGFGGFDIPNVEMMLKGGAGGFGGGAGGIEFKGRLPLPLPGDPIPAVIESNDATGGDAPKKPSKSDTEDGME